MTLYIIMSMVLEGYEGERVLLSYDVDGTARSVAARACQIVFGRVRTATGGSRRQEEGFVHRAGVVWIGQSVFVLPPRDAEELAARLRRIGVRVAMGPVTMARSALEAFHRPR